MTVDADVYRQVMGRLATGVTVLTTRVGDRHDTMTANAVMSVSLSPVLLVASVRSDCRWAVSVRDAGAFVVNVLSESQQALARWCSGPQRHADPGAVLGYPSRLTGHGLLLFDEALAGFECELQEQIEVGDHHLLVGAVTDLHVRDSGPPLLYFASDYASLGRPSAELLAVG